MIKKIIFILFLAVFVLAAIGASLFTLSGHRKEKVIVYYSKPNLSFWKFQSIDTMKYSRDLAREKMNDLQFDDVIDAQMKNIAAAGATHAAIATPYDEEFLPMLKRWVSAARKYDLKIWFRGNWSGWEQWFGYEKITQEDHIRKTREFILSNSDLFRDGDVFSGCPECENGGSGDPRSTGDVAGYRQFLIEEYQTTRQAFGSIKKQTASNYFSMNADVARLVMDKKTTAALDGIVTVDHYVETPQQMLEDVRQIAAVSGGKVVLGEFGAPIPDINGELTEDEQAAWVTEVLNLLSAEDILVGLNYWVNVGGSTEIWNRNGKALPASAALRRFYKPNAIFGQVRDEMNDGIAKAKITLSDRTVYSDDESYFEFPIPEGDSATFQVSAPGFIDQAISANAGDGQLDIVLAPADKGLKFKIMRLIKNSF